MIAALLSVLMSITPVSVDVVTRDEVLSQRGGWVHITFASGEVTTITIPNPEKRSK